MKKFLILFAAILAATALFAQKLDQGRSCGSWTAPCASKIDEISKLGIKYIEVTINPFYRKISSDKTEPMMRAMKKSIDSTDTRVWSVHLPFSKELDISVLNDSLRAQNVAYLSKIIKLCNMYKPKKLVLHPSSEPIGDEEREQRMINSIESISILSEAAEKIGAQLCIENLPRTCLGRNSQEIRRLVEKHPNVGVCFDTNHLLGETQHDFIQNVGNKIKTVHVSDYDFVDERHWLPGKGQINWGMLYNDLIKSGYKGVFMFECREVGAKELRESYNYVWKEYKKLKRQ